MATHSARVFPLSSAPADRVPVFGYRAACVSCCPPARRVQWRGGRARGTACPIPRWAARCADKQARPGVSQSPRATTKAAAAQAWQGRRTGSERSAARRQLSNGGQACCGPQAGRAHQGACAAPAQPARHGLHAHQAAVTRAGTCHCVAQTVALRNTRRNGPRSHARSTGEPCWA